MPVQCLDDPAIILQKDWCLNALSKDVGGTLHLVDSKSHQCHIPPCKTLKTVQQLKVKVAGHAPCDSPTSKLLDGTIAIDQLVTVFDQDATHRGFHAGNFVWQGAAGLQVTGRISGVTNV